MPITSDRIRKVYDDAYLNDMTEANISKKYVSGRFLDRGKVHRLYKDSDWYYPQDGRMRRTKQWVQRAQYAFSLCPYGAELDTHRAWESLQLGQIPIIQHSVIDSVYEGLPVAFVDNWDEVTEEKLDEWLTQFGDASHNPAYRERLSFKYWYEKVHGFKK